jgi:hypothetical protein
MVKCELTGRDTLDTTTTSETSDSGLGDTLDVVSQDLSVALGTALAETLSALAACRCVSIVMLLCMCARRVVETRQCGMCMLSSSHAMRCEVFEDKATYVQSC